jgi:hypothetical protein
MNQESINNLKQIEKILLEELNKRIKDADKNIAYKDFYINICKLIQLTQQNINIANRPDEHIKIKKSCNPDEKKLRL